jgi:acyl-CoA reductase-like NAD-dependent aldehyde dehydrogenase
MSLFCNFVNGAFQDCENHIEIEDPATENVMARCCRGTEQDMNAALLNSKNAFDSGVWSRVFYLLSHMQMSIQDRFQILLKIAALLREELPLWAGIEAQQTGRPVREMRVLGQLLILRLNWDDCRNGLSIMRLWCELMKAALCHLREM